jgi:hypothetical protein
VEVNSIVFTSGADSFGLGVAPSVPGVGGELIISGTGIIDNSGVLQALTADNTGQIIFKNTSTAGDARILSTGGDDIVTGRGPGEIIFNDSSTAESAFLIANGGCYAAAGSITFNGTSTGGTARVQVSFGCSNVSGIGYLDISGHQSGMTIGSIEGDGDVFLGANRLRVGTNNLSTNFSGDIGNDEQGSLTKVGTGILTLQPDNGFPPTLNLILVSGSPIKLDRRSPNVIASLKINGVLQPPGIYGGPMSGAPHIVPEFRGTGSVHVFPSTLANVSTRAFVQTGDNVMIGGFIIEETYSEVVIRAIGPELTRYHVPNALANPKLELHDATGALIASNDDWQHTIIGGVIRGNQFYEIRDSGHAPANPFESAIIATLAPGNYTAIVRGVNDTTGVGLVEVYDYHPDSHARDKVLGNVSTRSFVQTGDDVMIGGFVVQGSGAKRVIVRAIGPELSQHGVPNPLADPILELHNSTGALIAHNDNWMTTILGGIITRDQVQDIRDSGHAPTDARESAIIATLAPGNYTAIVRGVNNTTGVGLVEVYDLD